MAHNVNSMFSADQVPWHGLGKIVKGRLAAAEAIVAAGLDWEVEKRPIFIQRASDQGARFLATSKGQAVVRKDTGAVLGVVGPRWEPLQNKPAFSFFDEVVGKGQAIYETAGALGAGEKIWILAKLPGEIVIRKNEEDRTEKYLLFTNNHDGSAAVRMWFTPVRVVCQNTLSAATNLKRRDEGINLRHTKNIHEKVNEAQKALGLAVKFYDELGATFNTLAEKRAETRAVKAYFESLFPIPEEAPENEKAIENAHHRLAELQRAYRNDPTNNLPGIQETWWSAYNTVTGFTDHGRNHRGETESAKAEGRLKSIWFGSGAVKKRKALELAVTMAKAS